MFQTTSIFIFHQLPSNPLSDLKCPLEVVLDKVQWMAVWHCPLTPCSQAMPDTHSDVFSQALMSEVRAILERVVITCLSNVIFIGSSCLPTHSYGHTSVITVPCENHPGSTDARVSERGPGVIRAGLCGCPEGCGGVSKHFHTAPGLQAAASARTRQITELLSPNLLS